MNGWCCPQCFGAAGKDHGPGCVSSVEKQLADVTLERDIALKNLSKLQRDVRRALGVSKGEFKGSLPRHVKAVAK